MKKKILIADIDQVSLMYYEKIFFNHDIVATTNGKDALKLFLEHQPDLVIINSQLKNIDGFKVIKEIRAISEAVKISMVTTYHDDKEKALNIGCDSFYLKPISPGDLRKIVE